MAGRQLYPGASTAHWYQAAFPGDRMMVNTLVWHSTEGTALDDYAGGAVAPTLTAAPDWAAERLAWYQHFDFDVSARALVNAPGGVQTNTLNVAQVEVVGTCDPATHAKWTKAGTAHLYMPELPAWAIRDLGHFARWTHTEHGVPLTSGLKFTAFPDSYGTANGIRMSASQWEAFTGHCGHQHIPENLHGDPGAFPMAAILTVAVDKEDDMTPDQARMLTELYTDLSAIKRTNVETPEIHRAGYYLAVGEGHAHSADLKLDQVLTRLDAIEAHLGIPTGS